jgi:hypothetical protein
MRNAARMTTRDRVSFRSQQADYLSNLTTSQPALARPRYAAVRLEAGRSRHHCTGMGDKCRKRLEHLLMASADARKPEHILAMFETIKGRPATRQEIQQLHFKIPVARDTKRS